MSLQTKLSSTVDSRITGEGGLMAVSVTFRHCLACDSLLITACMHNKIVIRHQAVIGDFELYMAIIIIFFIIACGYSLDLFNNWYSKVPRTGIKNYSNTTSAALSHLSTY